MPPPSQTSTDESQKPTDESQKPTDESQNPIDLDVFNNVELNNLFTKQYQSYIKKTKKILDEMAKDSRRNIIIYDFINNLKKKNKDNIETIIRILPIFNYKGKLHQALYTGYQNIIGTETYGVTYITLERRDKEIFMLITPDTANEIITSLNNQKVFKLKNQFLELINYLNSTKLLNDNDHDKLKNEFQTYGLNVIHPTLKRQIKDQQKQIQSANKAIESADKAIAATDAPASSENALASAQYHQYCYGS